MQNFAPWIQCFQKQEEPKIRLLCFPFAGGAAQVFRTWQKTLGNKIEVWPVQLPGRWSRLREAPYKNVETLVQDVYAALNPLWQKPYVLFGHSMGGLITFELLRYLRSQNAALPMHCFFSGKSAPQQELNRPKIAHLPDKEFIQQMDELYKGIPPEVLEEEELLELLLPTLRADMLLYENYKYTPADAFATPFTILTGSDDDLTDSSSIEAWQALCSLPIETEQFPGGHFFLQSREQQILTLIRSTLERYF